MKNKRRKILSEFVQSTLLYLKSGRQFLRRGFWDQSVGAYCMNDVYNLYKMHSTYCRYATWVHIVPYHCDVAVPTPTKSASPASCTCSAQHSQGWLCAHKIAEHQFTPKNYNSVRAHLMHADRTTLAKENLQKSKLWEILTTQEKWICIDAVFYRRSWQ